MATHSKEKNLPSQRFLQPCKPRLPLETEISLWTTRGANVEGNGGALRREIGFIKG